MSSKSFDINICRGCESLYDDTKTGNINCRMAPEHDGIQCPCIKCLVKMRCRIDNCKDFQNYRMNLPVGYFHVRKE